MAEGCSENQQDAGARLSLQALEHRRLDFGQLVEDGLKIETSEVDAAPPLVVDRRRDVALTRFVDRCQKKLRKTKDEVAQAMVLALLVSDACGRSGSHASDLLRRHANLVIECTRASGELLLGGLLSDRAAGPEHGRQPLGAALAPHRAMLFKAVADWLGLFGCALEWGQEARKPGEAVPAWNVVQLSSHPRCVVDVMFDPGALYEEHSAKAQEYRRMLAEAHGRAPPAPSAREDLTGQMPRPPWHVEPWELTIQRAERIGRGGFGEVFHGRWEGVHVAVKEVKDTNPTDADVVDFILEIALLSQLNHPNVVRFWRGCSEIHAGSRSLLMVTEYVKTGGLSRLLHGHGGPPLPDPLTLPQALSFGLDIARGVQYLHSQRILHLDLKSPNVLCAPAWTAKLCDFGLAKIRGEQTVVQSTLQGVSPVWAPPEMLDDRSGGLTEKADVYSFAIIFFELLTKQVPFREASPAQLPLLKAAGQVPRMPEAVPGDCAELIRQCCVAAPSSRPSMSGVTARVREIAQARNIQLSDVRPPTALLQAEEGQEDGQAAEDATIKRLAELDGQRAQLGAELEDIQRQIAEERRCAAEAAAIAGGPSVARGPEDWCAAFVQEVDGSRFRCSLCSKLFRGPEFVRRHVASKHGAEAKRLVEDAYFDCDVSREDSLPLHGLSTRRGLGPNSAQQAETLTGHFSQALQDAAEHGDAARVLALLGSRADPGQRDEAGAGPLCLAARGGHLAVVEALLQDVGPTRAGELARSPTGAGLAPLQLAAQQGHCEVVTALLPLGSVDAACARGRTALLDAAEAGHLAACTLLLGARADAEARTPEGEALLHLAARSGEPELVGRLASWRADLAAQDKDGWAPLHEAAHWGVAAVEALCAARADVRARSRDGETALHVALEGYEQAEACGVLLRWGADPLAADVDGEGPLHVAVRSGGIEACRVLLEGRAGVNAADYAGRTPLDLAKHEEVRQLLLASGAAAGEARP